MPAEPTPARWRDGARLAVGTLTALPVPPPRALTPRVASAAMLLAPAVALLPAAAALAVAALARLAGLSALVVAVAALATMALGTRGIHLDGLADTADGLTASYDRDRSLEVMRRGNVGPAGAATLVLVLGLQVAALAQAEARHGLVVLVIAAIAGRAVLAPACARGIPAARAGGLGATVAGTVPRSALAPVLVATALATAGCGWTVGLSWWVGPLAVVAAVAAAATLLARAISRLGGVSGDVLGACVEVATSAALLVLAAAP